ncbi:MAG TPA: hypothetical protein VMZ53_31065 [Kofleriaceae bacterium]|nr:hypothetical protein [Kofleriaceae bacterium]
MKGAARLATLAAGLAFAACAESPLVPCGDLVCPPGNVCTAGGCAAPADVEACVGLSDGDPCRAATGGSGICQGGACHTGLCGNARIDVGEVCDGDVGIDAVLGQTCSGDCTQIYECGNAVVDPAEQCDDGNKNPADGCDACGQTAWKAAAIVGSRIAATAIPLAAPNAIAVDGQGRVFIADTSNHRVLRIEADGSVETLAGTGAAGYVGDGGAATSAQLAAPSGIAVDGIGRVYVADTGNHVVRLIDLDGTITTVAGVGVGGYDIQDEGRPAILAMLKAPHGLAVDGLGRLYIADTENQRVRRVDIDGRINTVAGNGVPGYSGDAGPAVDASLQTPFAVAIDTQDRMLVADTENNAVRRVDAAGVITTVTSGLSFPTGIAVDAQGTVYVADTGNQGIAKVLTNGTVASVAGTGTQGFAGDGGPAAAATLANPLSVAVDPSGRVLIADTSNQRIRRIDTTVSPATIDTIAGTGSFGLGGEGGQANSALLTNLYGVAVDAQGQIIIADAFNDRIRRVALDGTITTIAGAGTFGFSGDGGPATQAQLGHPFYVSLDPQGRVVFIDTFNFCIRRIETNGTITRIAGTGVSGYNGENLSATSSKISRAYGTAYDASGRLIIADTYGQRIRRVELNGNMVTIAGTGTLGYNGDNIAATSAQLGYPYDVAVDNQGRVVFSDTSNNRVRRIEGNGTIVTIAGTGTAGFNGDGIAATSAQIDSPYGIKIDANGLVVFADSNNMRIRRIQANGTITTIAGGAAGPNGDAGPATSAQLGTPLGIAIDPQNRLLVADTGNRRVRRVELDGTIHNVAGKVDPDSTGPVASARLSDPQQLAISSDMTLVAGGASGTLEIIRNSRVDAVAGRYPQNSPTSTLARFRTQAFGSVGGVAYDEANHRIFVSETSSNRIHVITQVNPADPSTWTIAALANTAGVAGFADGSAGTARFRGPTGLYYDAGLLYIADTDNHAIRVLNTMAATVSTLVNTTHRLGFAGDGGLAAGALLYRPTALTRCANGNMFIADTGNNRVRRLENVGSGSETISTVLGDGVFASSGEGSPARTFPVAAPRGVTCDSFGNVFVSSTTTVRMLAAGDNGVVDGAGNVFTIYGAPPRVSFPSSVTTCLTAVASTGSTTLQISDRCTGLLIELVRGAAQ